MASIVAKNVSVELPVYGAQDRSLKRQFLGVISGGGRMSLDRGHVIIHALQKISFVAEDGDRIALIGRNGAGKSTLLRALAGLTEPNEGVIQVEGKVASLLNISGFLDGNATGYENIQYAGRLLGLGSSKIKEIIPEIEEFTELGAYLSLPVRTYSAGMSVRLALAIATAIEPEILLLDEGISAGDAHFVKKSTDRATRLYDRAKIIVMASHDEAILRRMCNKALLLEAGRVVASGDVGDILDLYAKHGAAATARGSNPSVPRRVFDSGANRDGSAKAHVLDSNPHSYWSVKSTENSWVAVEMSDLDGELDPIAHAMTFQLLNISKAPPPSALVIECSDDFFAHDVRKVADIVIDDPVGQHSVLFDRRERARHWRVRAPQDHPDISWGLVQLEFHIGEPTPITDPASQNRMPSFVSTPDDDAWVSEVLDPAKSPAERWIGFDYGDGVRVSPHFVSIRQWRINSADAHLQRVCVECSDDNFEADIRKIGVFDIQPPSKGIVQYRLPPHSQTAAYWRITAVEHTGMGIWGISWLSFDAEAATLDIERARSDACAA